MKVNLNIVEKLVGFKLPPVDELVARVNAQLGEVEEVTDLGAKYKDAKIVKVVECEKHPNADKLSICKIDDGSGELTQVVCGAPNVHADMWAIWLPPGSTVPATFDDAEPFVLGARELRGVMSQGMLSAADELGIGTDHNGIIEITDADLPDGAVLSPGLKFAEMFGLDGYVIDIENKMFTHRPDCFGQIGVAREIAGILGANYENPEWYIHKPDFAKIQDLTLEVFNDNPEKTPRFLISALKNVTIQPSPLWLQCEIVSLGGKPINNVVDITNYIMLMTAQPTHAYDYDKLRGHTIGVRLAKSGEEIHLLNDKTYQLTDEDIVIVDGDGPIGLAGVMGGIDSEVTNETKNVVLEVATFDMYSIRKTSMRHGLFTDAVTRFNKGQSPLQNAYVMARLMSQMTDLAGATQASCVFDVPEKSNLASEQYNEISISQNFINNRLGLTLETARIAELLRCVNFSVNLPDNQPDELLVFAPFWRTDIELPEDIVEEVGRLYGFDKIPRELPLRSTQPAPKNSTRLVKQLIRKSLMRAGANEVLTYSFVHENVLKKAEQDKTQAFKLSNALSPDLQYYRLSVLPSLLDKVHMNIKAGHDEFLLYEIGKGHDKTLLEKDVDGLPVEYSQLDMVYSSKKPKTGAPFYQIKQTTNHLFGDLGISTFIEPITEDYQSPMFEPFDLDRSALVWSETRNSPLGVVGEFKRSVIQSFKLPEYTAGASFDLKFIELWWSKSQSKYKPLSRFPSITKDVSLIMPSDTVYSQVLDEVRQIVSSSDLDVIVSPISIYQASGSLQKTITFSLRFTSHERTLTDKDTAPIIAEIENLNFK